MLNLQAEKEKLPTSNTGVLNTSGRQISLDYVAFTVPNEYEQSVMINEFFSDYDIDELAHGGMGYKKSWAVNGTGRMYSHPDQLQMGIHIRLGSQALGLLKTTPLGLLNRVLDWGGHFTRLDIAFDDLDGILDLDEMHRKLVGGSVVTRWRKVTKIQSNGLGVETRTGSTVNVGGRTSEAFLRIYDKVLEQEARGKSVDGIDYWIRVELELKKAKADAFVRLLCETAKGGEVTAAVLCCELLFGMIDFKVSSATETNKSRWETCGWWSDFCGGCAKLTLCIQKTEKTLADSREWIQTAISPTLAMIMLALPEDGGETGYDFIMGCIYSGQRRMSKAQKRMLNSHNASVESG